MRRSTSFFLLVISVRGGWRTPSIDGAPVFDLGGDEWTMAAWSGPGTQNCSSINRTIKATVPGDHYTDLWHAGVIGDPMETFGDHRTAWAGRTSWTYTRQFSRVELVTALGGTTDDVVLVAEGLETNATVFLNGHALFSSDDMWVRRMMSVGRLLNDATNEVQVRFVSVYDACDFEKWPRANVTCPDRVYIRQSASSWGWDWANRYSPQGIWRPFYFVGVPESSAAVTSVSAVVRPVSVSTARRAERGHTVVGGGGGGLGIRSGQSDGVGAWVVDVVVGLRVSGGGSSGSGNISGIVRVVGEWPGATAVSHFVTFARPTTPTADAAAADDTATTHDASDAATGELQVAVRLQVRRDEVELWWPIGLGEQKLYNISASFASANVTRPPPRSRRTAPTAVRRVVGFRSVRLQTDFTGTNGTGTGRGGGRGSGNTSMLLSVNGQRVLVRGSSLVPPDTFTGRMLSAGGRRRAFQLLASVAAAGMNAVRVWGGGTFLPPPFYDEADRLGVMLLHDFMLSWYPGNPYPAFPAFLSRLRLEAAQKFAELSRHPAIVVWFGGNEDQCTRYDPARADGCVGDDWYADCAQVFADCKAVYIDTVLSAAADLTAVPLWPVSPSAGWASGVDRATGVPNGEGPLVEREDALATPARPLQGALDVHGPYNAACRVHHLGVPAAQFQEQRVLFHSEFGELALPQFETIQAVTPDSADWTITSAAMNERSPNGAGNLATIIDATLGPALANYTEASEKMLRRVIYLSQLVQSECLRATVDGGRLGQAAITGEAGAMQRPWGYMYWQLNDVGAFNSWGSLEYGGRWKIAHYTSQHTFADVRVGCNMLGSGIALLENESNIACVAANDGTRTWSGNVSLAASAMTANADAPPDWASTFTVDALEPGHARRFFSGVVPPATARTRAGHGPRWLYSPQEHLGIGLPLVPMRQLVLQQKLPKATVVVRAVKAATSAPAHVRILRVPQVHLCEVEAAGAVALYVHVTSSCLGAFSSNGFHLPAGKKRTLSFDAWAEADTGATCGDFAASLQVQWLNKL